VHPITLRINHYDYTAQLEFRVEYYHVASVAVYSLLIILTVIGIAAGTFKDADFDN